MSHSPAIMAPPKAGSTAVGKDDGKLNYRKRKSLDGCESSISSSNNNIGGGGADMWEQDVESVSSSLVGEGCPLLDDVDLLNDILLTEPSSPSPGRSGEEMAISSKGKVPGPAGLPRGRSSPYFQRGTRNFGLGGPPMRSMRTAHHRDVPLSPYFTGMLPPTLPTRHFYPPPGDSLWPPAATTAIDPFRHSRPSFPVAVSPPGTTGGYPRPFNRRPLPGQLGRDFQRRISSLKPKEYPRHGVAATHRCTSPGRQRLPHPGAAFAAKKEPPPGDDTTADKKQDPSRRYDGVVGTPPLKKRRTRGGGVVVDGLRGASPVRGFGSPAADQRSACRKAAPKKTTKTKTTAKVKAEPGTGAATASPLAGENATTTATAAATVGKADPITVSPEAKTSTRPGVSESAVCSAGGEDTVGDKKGVKNGNDNKTAKTRKIQKNKNKKKQQQPPWKDTLSKALLHLVCRYDPKNHNLIEQALQRDSNSVRRRVPLAKFEERLSRVPPSSRQENGIDNNNDNSIKDNDNKAKMTQPPAGRRQSVLRKVSYSLPVNIAIQNGASSQSLAAIVRVEPRVLKKRDGPAGECSLHVAVKSPADTCPCEIVCEMLAACPGAAAVTDLHHNTVLHAACAYRPTDAVTIRALVRVFPYAARRRNFHGQTPLQLLQQYGGRVPGGAWDDDSDDAMLLLQHAEEVVAMAAAEKKQRMQQQQQQHQQQQQQQQQEEEEQQQKVETEGGVPATCLTREGGSGSDCKREGQDEAGGVEGGVGGEEEEGQGPPVSRPPEDTKGDDYSKGGQGTEIPSITTHYGDAPVDK